MRSRHVDILNETRDRTLPVERLREAAIATLNEEYAAQEASLSVLLTGDVQLRRMNRQFRSEDKPTDVLSFPTGEVGAGADSYLGDIAISVQTARRQAEAGGHDLESELLLLTVHGVLHLLGHDHGQDEEQARMWAAQETILAKLGVDASRILKAHQPN